MMALSAHLERLCQARPSDWPELMRLHAYRYRHFVISSPRGRHCRYAVATLRLYQVDDEEQIIRQYADGLPPALRTRLLEML